VSFALAHTIFYLERQAQAIEKAGRAPKGYLSAMEKLGKEHAEKDEKGARKVIQRGTNRDGSPSQAFVLANPAAYEKAVEALRAEHKMDEWEKKLDEFLDDQQKVEYLPIQIPANSNPWPKPKFLANVMLFVKQ
jgi:hypothetical protein